MGTLLGVDHALAPPTERQARVRGGKLGFLCSKAYLSNEFCLCQGFAILRLCHQQTKEAAWKDPLALGHTCNQQQPRSLLSARYADSET